jgi:two-component system chemotaxis response regulator CheY
MTLAPSTAILVVDDSKTVISIVRNHLRQIGFTDVDDADDGASALEKLGTRNYGLVISDWNMQSMSGYEFLRQIRDNEKFKRIPFIMMTGAADIDKVVAAKKAGVDGYVVKPFNAATLTAKITTVLAARSPQL